MTQQPDNLVLITGSSGLIGAATCHELEEAGYRTFGFDRPGHPHPPDITEAVDCDVTDQASVDAALETVKRDGGDRIASVVHLAAYYDFSGGDPELYDKITVRGTERLLKSLQRHGFTVEQFIFGSSMLVHAPGEPGDRIDETSPVAATWDYPKSKIDTERLLSEQRGTIPVVLLRIAGVYNDAGNSIPIANQIQRIYERDMTSYVFPGDADAGQSFVHLDDAVKAIRLCIDRRRELPPVCPILIGEEEVMSYRELQQTIGELIHGKAWSTFRVPKAVAQVGAFVQEKLPGEDPFIKPWMIARADDHYEVDASRSRELLGWHPAHSLRGTLPKMIESLKADPAGFYKRNKLKGEPPR